MEKRVEMFVPTTLDALLLNPFAGLGTTRFFSNPAVAYLHAHYAKRGCYAARIVRA